MCIRLLRRTNRYRDDRGRTCLVSQVRLGRRLRLSQLPWLRQRRGNYHVGRSLKKLLETSIGLERHMASLLLVAKWLLQVSHAIRILILLVQQIQQSFTMCKQRMCLQVWSAHFRGCHIDGSLKSIDSIDTFRIFFT